jgi:hypothetical protein
VLRQAEWSDVPGLRHGFLDGQDSAGEWDAVLARLGLSGPLLLPRQVHGTCVVEARRLAPTPDADAVWSAEPGVLVGIVTADCVPVLLVDRRRRVAAAVHAGWRGASAGVLEATVEALQRDAGISLADLEAAVGPAIGGCCYEVREDVVRAFTTRTGDLTAPAWTERQGRRHVDLRTAARLLLVRAGVSRVGVLGPCTACAPGYHSYRRDGSRGRQLSFAGWA